MNNTCANCGASLAGDGLHCTACGTRADQPDRTALRGRVFLPQAVDFWWLGIPRKLRRYSRLLWAAWSDGIYLTGFPRIAVAFPIVLLLFGFFEGASHWSPLTIDSNALNPTIPAVTFAQILHLLFIAALVGSMSADLGLMIVVGYALGDYLVAGPFFRFGPWAPVSGFFSYRVPQLFTYWIFLSLAVAPTVGANGLLSPVRRWLPRDNTASVMARVAASAVVQALLVYLWIPLATVTVRVVWAWVQQTPPLDVSNYIRMLNPWLPLAAGVGVILRAILVRVTRGDQQLKLRTKQLQEDAVEADRNLAWTRRVPVWLRAILSGAASTVMLSGLISNGWSAIVVGGGLVGVCLLRSSWLPRLAWWLKWIDTIERIPLIFRLASTTVITYYLTLGLLQIPGSAPGLNPKAGQFQAELACLGAGLLIMIVLMPFVPAPSETNRPAMSLPLPSIRAVSSLVLVGLILFASAPVYAICLDPLCCFGSPANAALAVSCLLLVLALFTIGAAAIAAVIAEGAAEAAAMGEGAAALADTALANTALADTATAGSISPMAQTVFAPVSGVADTAILNTISPLAQTVAAPISALADTAIGDAALSSAIDPLAQTAAAPALGLADTVPAAGGLGLGAGTATGTAAVDVGTAVAGGATAVGAAALSGSGSLSGSSGSASDVSATSGSQIGSGESGSTGSTSSGPTTGTTAQPSASQPATSGTGVMGGTSSGPGSSSSGTGTSVIGSGSPAGSASSGPASSSSPGIVGSGSGSSGTGTAAPSGGAPSGPVSSTAPGSTSSPGDAGGTGTGTVPSAPVSNSASTTGASPSASSTGTPAPSATQPVPQPSAPSNANSGSVPSNSPTVATPAESLPTNP